LKQTAAGLDSLIRMSRDVMIPKKCRSMILTSKTRSETRRKTICTNVINMGWHWRHSTYAAVLEVQNLLRH